MASSSGLDSLAVVMEAPERLSLRRLALRPPEPLEVLVDIEWSGISTGTERLLWSGRMPHFPGMGYPLVPGYESIGRIVETSAQGAGRVGQKVFVPGSNCFRDARGLFGGAARRVIVPAARAIEIAESVEEEGVLIALAATAMHALRAGGSPPELIVGYGVLGRLLARLVVATGAAAPTVWEVNATRRESPSDHNVIAPDSDPRRDYRVICDASGDPDILDSLIARLARGGEIVLAGFYERPLSFNFPPSFMREARLRVAAEWLPDDLSAVLELMRDGRLSLDGLITHRMAADQADDAYRTAFGQPDCLKMVLDWRQCA